MSSNSNTSFKGVLNSPLITESLLAVPQVTEQLPPHTMILAKSILLESILKVMKFLETTKNDCAKG